MFCEDLGSRQSPVGNGYRFGLGVKQWANDAARRTTGAENQNTCVLEFEAEVTEKVTHEPDAVGVVAENLFIPKYQGIDCTRTVGALAEIIDQSRDFALVRQGYVQALASRTLKLPYRGFEFVGRDLKQFILQVFACL